MARDLNVALIGQAFMGKAHSNAWSQAPRFFDLPVNPVMHTVAARNAETLECLGAVCRTLLQRRGCRMSG